MIAIQENKAILSEITKLVKSHCMCLKFEETRTHFRVIYPEGYYPNGVQVSKALGKAEALRKILVYMESHWQSSLWWKN